MLTPRISLYHCAKVVDEVIAASLVTPAVPLVSFSGTPQDVMADPSLVSMCRPPWFLTRSPLPV